MAKTMIIVVEDGKKKYRIHPRYSNYIKDDGNFKFNPKFLENNKVDFRLLIFKDKETRKKAYMLIDIDKLKENGEYEKCEKARKSLCLTVDKARTFEVEDKKIKEILKPLCNVAVKHNSQVSLKDDPRIIKIRDDEYEFIEDDDDIPFPLSDQDDESSRTSGGKPRSEGKRRLVKAHYVRERDPGIRKEKIKAVRKDQGKLSCEICHVVEGDIKYPSDFRAERIFEVHHIKPLSKVKEEFEPKLEDLALLCANCHRMVHINAEVEENFRKLKKCFK